MIIEGAIVEDAVVHAAKDGGRGVEVAHVQRGDIAIDLGLGAAVADHLGGDTVAGEVGLIAVLGGTGLRLAEIGIDIVTKIHLTRTKKVERNLLRWISKAIMALGMNVEVAGLGEIDLVLGREVVEVGGGEMIGAIAARGAGAVRGVWMEKRKRRRMAVPPRKASLTTQKKEHIRQIVNQATMMDQDTMIVEAIVMNLTVITTINGTVATWMSVI